MRLSRSAFAFLFIISNEVAAQTSTGGKFCVLKPQPAPACGSFLVMEAAIEFPFASTSTDILPAFSSQTQRVKDYRTRYTVSVGGMVNRGATSAIGGKVGFALGTSSFELPSRAELVVRNWHGKSAVDFSAGAARRGIASRNDGNVVRAYGGTAAVGVEYGYVGADLRLDVLRGEGRTVAGGFLGAKATSAGAPIAVTLATLALFALVASIGN